MPKSEPEGEKPATPVAKPAVPLEMQLKVAREVTLQTRRQLADANNVAAEAQAAATINKEMADALAKDLAATREKLKAAEEEIQKLRAKPPKGGVK